jgi:hypothetical protein
LHPIILDEKSGCLYYFTSWTCIMNRFLTFTFSKVNNSNTITLNIVIVDLQWQCNPKHGWLHVVFHMDFSLHVVVQAQWCNMLANNNKIQITNFMGHDLTIIVMKNLFFIGLYGIDTYVIHLCVLFEHQRCVHII